MTTHFKILLVHQLFEQATSLAHIANVNKNVLNKLTPDQLEIFKRTIFGRFVDMDMVFNNSIAHQMLLREVKMKRGDIGGEIVIFSKDAFLLMANLW